MTRQNDFIRDYARNKGVCLWKVADALGINECSLSRMLRYELSEDMHKEITEIIDRLSDEVLRNE